MESRPDPTNVDVEKAVATVHAKNHDHNHVNSRVLLIEYDRGLAEICREVFGDTELKYTKPATRLSGHMASYDPATAPKFAWPPHLAQAQAEIRLKAIARDTSDP